MLGEFPGACIQHTHQKNVQLGHTHVGMSAVSPWSFTVSCVAAFSIEGRLNSSNLYFGSL